MPQIVEMYVAQNGTWVEMPGATVDSTVILGEGLDSDTVLNANGNLDLALGPIAIHVDTGAAIDTADGVSVKVDNESLEILPYAAGDPTTDVVKVKLDPDSAITSGPSGLNIDTGAGIIKGVGGLAVNVDDDTLEVSTSPGQSGDDWVKVKDLGIANRHLNATVGGLTNVDISADGAGPGQALVSDGNEFLAQDIAVIDMTTPPAVGEVPVWDPALGNPPGTGAWVPTTLAVDTPVGSGLTGGGPLMPGVSLNIDTGAGIVKSGNNIAVNVDDVTLEVADVGGVAGDFVKVKDLGISNRHLNATIGGLTNVDITADAPTAPGVPLIWDSTAGEWVAGLTAAPLSTEITLGNGLNSDTVPNGNGNLDLALGPVELHADLGSGLINDPTDGSTTINLDNGNPGAATLPQALEITPFLAGDPDSDILQVKWLGIKNEHIGAQIGSLTDVNISASDSLVQGSVLYTNGTEWLQYDPAAASNPVLILGPIDGHSDVDTSTVPPVPGEGLIWDGTTWLPGAPVGQGITPLTAADVATTGPIDLTVTQTEVDGFTTPILTRILVKDQVDAFENGIYTNNTPMARVADVSVEGDLIPGNSVLISNGDVNGGLSFLVALDALTLPWTPDVDDDRWFASFSKLDVQAGDGLVLDGKILHVVPAPNEGLYVSPDDIGIEIEGVKDKHIGAVLGAMLDVEMASASPGITAGIDGAALIWSAPLGQWQMGANKAPISTKIIPVSGLEITGNDDLSLGSVTVGIAPLGVQDEHMGAQLGSLTNVNDTATVAPLLNAGLIWSGAEWTASTLPVGTVGDLAIDDLTDVDTTSAPPAALQALVWSAGGQWVPGNVVSFGTPPAVPGVPVWTPGTGWVSVDLATQAGAGLLPGATAGVLDVVAAPLGGIAVTPDAVAVNRTVVDNWYVSTTVDDTMAGGLTVQGASGLSVTAGGASIVSPSVNMDIGQTVDNAITAFAQTGRIALYSNNIQAFDATTTAAFLATAPEHVVTKEYLDTPGTILGSVDRHSDVDTTTAGPVPDQALLWNGTNWIPGDVVALAAPPVTNTPGVPVWDGGAWVSVTPTTQAGAGLKVGAGTGIIDVGANADTSILVNPDDIQVNRALLDTWYPAIPSPAPGTGLGNIIVWDGNDWVSVPSTTVAGLGLIPSTTLGGIDINPGLGLTVTDATQPDKVAIDRTITDTWYPAVPPPTSTGGDTIVWDGAKWVSVDAATTAGAGLATNPAILGEVNVGAVAGSGILVNPNDIAIDRNVTDDWYPALPGAPTNPGDSIFWDGTQWVIISAAQQAGAGLISGSLTGSMDVVAADGSILVQPNDIQVAPKGITAAKIADGAVGNLQSSVTLGGLNNVDITADAPAAAGHTIVWNGTEWVAQATAAPTPQPISWLTDADTTAATSVIGDVLTWNGTNWVQGVRVDLTTDQTIAGTKTFSANPLVPKLQGGEDGASAVDKDYVDGAISLLSGQSQAVGIFNPVTNQVTNVFAGAPGEFVAGSPLPGPAITNAGSYVLVSVDANGAGTYPTAGEGDWIISDGFFAWTLIPLTNTYVTETDSPSVAGDISGTYAAGFQIVDKAVKTADLDDGAVTNLQLGASIGGLTNVDITADAATNGQALVWDGTASEWLPGDVVSFGAPPTGTAPGIPVWDPALGWITIDAATQAGAGLVPGATAGVIDVNPGTGISLTVVPDSVSVDKTVLDGWYPSIDGTTPPADGDTIIWDSGTGSWVPQAPEPGALAGAGITLNADGITFDVVSTTADLVVGADSLTVVSAPKWTTARNISAAGEVTIPAVSVDGSAAVALTANLTARGLTIGDLLTWNGTTWVAQATVAGTGYTAGAGLVETTASILDVATAAGSGILVTTDAIATDPAIVQYRAEKGVANGYAPLDAGNLVPSVHIPPLAISEVFVVPDLASRLALVAQRGDVAVQTDTSLTYILSTDVPANDADWLVIQSPSSVLSVNGYTGVVDLTYTDVDAAAATTTLTAGLGLVGGGDLTAPRTFDVGAGVGIAVAADAVSVDRTVTDTWYSATAHAHTLDSLTDADTTTVAPLANDLLTFNGTNWVPVAPTVTAAPLAGAGLSSLTTPGAYDVVATVGEGLLVGVDDVGIAPKGVLTKHIADLAVTDLQLGAQLGALTNVEMATTEVGGTQADGDVLTYDLATTTWKAKPTAAAGIPVFANAAARDVAIPLPTEGLYCRLLDTDKLQTYSGALAGWVNVVSVTDDGRVAVGNVTTTGAISTVAVGDSVDATGEGTTAVGYGARGLGTGQTAIGSTAQVSAAATNSTALGIGAKADTPNTVALGTSAEVLRIPTGTGASPEGTMSARAGSLYAVDTGLAGELWLKTTTAVASTPDTTGWAKAAIGDFLPLTGGTLVNGSVGIGINTSGAPISNIRYNKAGPADTLGASGPIVTPDLAASIQYVDDLVTVAAAPPVTGTIPKRDGQVWYVITTPPPPAPITPTAVATTATVNTVSWTEP